MTVKELIKELEKQPQNTEVMYYDGDDGWTTPRVEYLADPPYSYYHQEKKLGHPVVSLTY